MNYINYKNKMKPKILNFFFYTLISSIPIAILIANLLDGRDGSNLLWAFVIFLAICIWLIPLMVIFYVITAKFFLKDYDINEKIEEIENL